MTIVKELLNDGLNICGAVSPSNEEENVFFVTFVPAEEGKSPKQYKSSTCGVKEADDGLPTMLIVTEPLSNGDCKIIKTEDQGV